MRIDVLAPAAVLTGLFMSGPAFAACPEQSMEEALALRVDEATLRQLVEVGLGYLPGAIGLPAAEREIFSCPFDTSAAVGLVDTEARFEILSHQVTLEDDALRVVAQVDLHVDGEVEAKLCDIPTDCQLRATARRATISGRVRPALDSCQLKTEFEDVDIQVDSDDVDIELSECAIVSTVVDLVLRGFQSLILRVALPFLESYVQDDFPAIIDEAQVGVVLPSFSAFGVDVTVAPNAVRFGPGSVQVSAAAWAAPSGPPAACVPLGSRFSVDAQAQAPVEVQLSPEESARVYASQDFLQQVLLSAWGAGLLCFDLEEMGVDLTEPLRPIFPGVEMSAEIRSASAPVLRLDQQGARDVVLEVPAVEAAVQMELPGDAPALARAQLGARIAARVVVDPASTSIGIEPIGLELTPATIELPEHRLGVRKEGLERLYSDLLAPLVFGRTGRLTLLDAVFAGAPVALELTDVAASRGALEAGLKVWPKDPSDTQPPTTRLHAAPRGPVGAEATIEMASTDLSSPDHLLRHRVIVDGIPEEATRPGSRFTLLGLTPGEHRVEIQAIDLAENVGPSVAFGLQVDLTPPEVRVEGAPTGVIASREAAWEVYAVDDVSAAADLRARYVLEAWGPAAGARVIVDEGPVALGQPFRLTDLPEDRVLAVRFVVTDEAGNAGEAMASFAADTNPTVGCRAAGSTPSWLALFAALGLLARRRRGRAEPSRARARGRAAHVDG